MSALHALFTIASLCMPPSVAQTTGSLEVKVVELRPAMPIVVAGFSAENSPYVKAKVEYLVGTSQYPRFFTVYGYASDIRALVGARLPKLPDCVPVG